MSARVLIVNDVDGLWYVRRVYSVEQDLEANHKVYRCDKHLGGPCRTLAQAARLLPSHIKPKKRKGAA
jgi:hypothetical protein